MEHAANVMTNDLSTAEFMRSTIVYWNKLIAFSYVCQDVRRPGSVDTWTFRRLYM